MATQTNLTGSPFRYVNIYRCCSNGASDPDSLPPGKNAQCDVGSGHHILLTAEEGGIFMKLNRICTSCVSEHQVVLRWLVTPG